MIAGEMVVVLLHKSMNLRFMRRMTSMVSLSSSRTELDAVGPNTWSEHMPHTTKYKN